MSTAGRVPASLYSLRPLAGEAAIRQKPLPDLPTLQPRQLAKSRLHRRVLLGWGFRLQVPSAGSGSVKAVFTRRVAPGQWLARWTTIHLPSQPSLYGTLPETWWHTPE